MSVAHGGEDTLFGWVGIIMYLCSEDEGVRREITDAFRRYSLLLQGPLSDKYNAEGHWAKLQLPEDAEALDRLRTRIHRRFPVDAFNAYRKQLDPKNILSNKFIDALFGVPS